MTENIPIWRIKYFPRTLSNICGREKIIKRLKKIIIQKNFPHLLFVGTEGIGKTTIAHLFSKEFLGKAFDANFKLIYADVPLNEEERKLAKSEAYISKSRIGSTAGKRITTPAFIQAKVKPFVQLKALGYAPFKILIVKDFDKLGSNQQGFRRLMEAYGSNCRMILITTKVSGIIDPIASRCQLFLISQVNYIQFKKLIEEIATAESLNIKENVIKTLYKISEGKISKAIDLLQLSHISGSEIDNNILFEFSKKFRNEDIKTLLQISFQGSFLKARELARKVITTYKYDSHEIFSLILDEMLKLPLNKYAQANLISIIADADIRAIDGRDDDIQISNLLSKICLFSENM